MSKVNEYEFNTSLSCDFITPELDKIQFPMIAEYTVDYDGSIYVDRILPKKMTTTGLIIANFLNKLKDFDHLKDEIEQVEATKQEAEELSRLSGGEL